MGGRGMKRKNRCWLSVVIVSAFIFASAVGADSGRGGQGLLKDVDRSALTIRVKRTTLKIGPATQILDPQGNRLSLSELLDREGDPVRYRAASGSPYPVLQSIVVQHPEEAR